ncbi:hypothetical protein DAEQUDRAFT_732659 [Daedalea quercina L-15889]|uniref:BTB domain-containing protein n=1 Tax=Daedalea quercina L-15889 TaxID=1314783 RepID=A0A165LHI9_9APHY|nr:hypothetical protein DAEQUDRAFT_732659 [Daedalea quercina L-15889]
MSETSHLRAAESSPPRKRTRVETDSGITNEVKRESFTRDEKFWYDDGNIVVVAEDVGFRLYKGLLARQSDVFRDMFDLPQPASDGSRDDALVDCAVVHVADSPAEIRSLLRVLLDGRRYMQRFDIDFEDVANCIRLGHKYAIMDLLEDSMREFKCYFPVDFKSWDTKYELPKPIHPVVAVNLARLTNTPSILPAALYLCCQMDGAELSSCAYTGDSRNAVSQVDLARCINGKAKLCTRAAHMIREIFAPIENASCSVSDNRCKLSLSEKQLEWSNASELDGRDCDLLRSWGSYIRRHDRKIRPKPASPMCASCIAALCQREKAVRKGLWSDLPELCGLEKDDEDKSTDGSEHSG